MNNLLGLAILHGQLGRLIQSRAKNKQKVDFSFQFFLPGLTPSQDPAEMERLLDEAMKHFEENDRISNQIGTACVSLLLLI